MKKIAIVDNRVYADDLASLLDSGFEVSIFNRYTEIRHPNDFDIIFIEFIGLDAVIASQKKHKCLVIRTNGVEIYEGKVDRVEWENVHTLCFLQKHQMEYFKTNHCECSPKNMVIFPPCIHPRRFKIRKNEKNNKVAIIANVTGRKGLSDIPRFLRMYPELQIYHIGSVCAYGGSTMDYINYHTKNDGTANRYHFMKKIPHGQITTFLDDKTYLLSMSIGEGFGRNILEGMYKGLKPIIHYFPGAVDIWGNEYVYTDLGEIKEMLTSYEPDRYRKFAVDNYSVNKALEVFNNLKI